MFWLDSLLLSIIGGGVTDAYEGMSYGYWLAMVPVFFSACLLIEWKASRKHGMPLNSVLIKQLQHWLGLLAGVYLTTFILPELSSLNHEDITIDFRVDDLPIGRDDGIAVPLAGYFSGIVPDHGRLSGKQHLVDHKPALY